MEHLQNITVTDIEPPFTVHFKRSNTVLIKNRRLFAVSFCTEGQITYRINGERIASDKNCAVILPKGGTYSIFGDKGGVFPIINFKCEGFECDSIIKIPIKDLSEYINDFEKIKSLFLFKENRLKAYGLFYEILHRLSNEQHSKSSIIYPAMKYIEDNLSNTELTNQMLAYHLGISEVYLRKLFSEQYGTTPKQHILDIRIKKAKQLLTDSALTVTAISEQCGYASVYHFCRAFKEKVGITPTEYAKQNKVYKI